MFVRKHRSPDNTGIVKVFGGHKRCFNRKVFSEFLKILTNTSTENEQVGMQGSFNMSQKEIEAFARDRDYFRKNPDRLLADEGWTRSMARSWSRHMRMDREAINKMTAESSNARVLKIRYEKVHEDVESERSRMYRFLDLDASEAIALSSETELIPGLASERPTEMKRTPCSLRSSRIASRRSDGSPSVLGRSRRRAPK